ncbi:dihydrolipoamide acetyltransferase family protein [Lacicoccus qingdaonensis]|uniref:Dihydrolipoamide acetyltransferase component of pyruvate dehydrogenase complex n=1 Tax=Lacicoccus qingdaonensis TaxID=576118 RepID=A0A1G9J273_9BACL|nr:dihydrolipoamide acetyltransferase family protein [Salinicoccus qingdaonensis]SDL31590.1 pyruvate dehydrogenase E2 component (dihydrolipoamide acetyltransferase) [Salinicoccus qingdaonensis]
MAMEIKLPRQSEKLDESLITFWQVSEGDTVEKGDVLVEVQTEKAISEVEAPESGVIKEIVKKRGDTVRVDEVLAVLDAGRGEREAAENKEQVESEGYEEKVTVEEEKPSADNKKATPRVKKFAKELGIDWQLVTPERSDGKVTEDDVRNFAEVGKEEKTAPDVAEALQEPEMPKRQVLATPSVRKYARDNDLMIDSAQQSYITDGQKDDGKKDKEKRVSPTGIRKVVARTMAQSVRTIPHVTHFDEANVTKLAELRDVLKMDFEVEDVKLTYMAFVVKALTKMLYDYPYLNASFDEDSEKIILKEHYNIGFAADTDQGLLVPVIRNTDQRSLFQIAKEIQDLADKARNGNVTSDEMAGGTATISNVGSAGGAFFTPIINPPQSSILGIGRIEKKVIPTDDDAIEIQPMMALSLSYDHRVIDGVMAQEAMNELKRLLEEPGLLLAY